MEMAIAQQLMEWRGAYGPEAQQRILRKATLSITDDAAEANALVPSTPPVTHSQFAAMAIFGTLMKGGLADFPDTMNRLDLARTLTAELVLATRRGARTPEDVAGLQNVLQTAGKLVAEVAADDANADAAKAMQATLAKAEQAIKGFAQDVAKAAAEAGANGNGADAELAAKLKATVITAQAKAANTRESHAQRTAQRQVQFELEQERKKREHTQDLAQQAQQHALDLAAEEAKLQLEIERERQKPAPAPAAAE